MPHTPLHPRHRANAKSMRRVMTDAELKLWNELRAHRLMGLGFRRQFPIASYIVDFACPEKKLVPWRISPMPWLVVSLKGNTLTHS
ncbi:hypothetical protein MESS2_220038 [Mesorhizobium metallidurans STM 2683]|uniref:DUF559 domain-containing protein n=1 Tax=Mesorhizobium metallidurans STM 2683 TaxID=1297569 RepID=M5F2M7_9HYPH|nr:hypothetical protein MESS2_220038 [Mesorhizobium metallidurans STM 2683]